MLLMVLAKYIIIKTFVFLEKIFVFEVDGRMISLAVFSENMHMHQENVEKNFLGIFFWGPIKIMTKSLVSMSFK